MVKSRCKSRDRNPSALAEGRFITFICYERCTTGKKAQKWLDTKGVEYKVRPIKEAEWEETVL